MLFTGFSSSFGERINEDTFGSFNNVAWVLDGASQPAETVGDALTAKDFVEKLNVYLMEAVINNPSFSLAQLVSQAVKKVSVFWGSSQGPAATIAAVKYTKTQTQWFVLGDSFIIFKNEGVVSLVSDERLNTVAVLERKKVLNASPTDVNLKEYKLALYEKEQGFRNKENGYWVLANDASAPFQALTGVLAANEPVLLGTDGFSDVFNTPSSALTPSNTYEALTSSKDASGAVKNVHEVLSNVVPRRYKIDDATILITSRK